MRLRQVALVAAQLEPVVADLEAVLGIRESFRDPGVAVFGLQNAVLPVGDSFLEVVSPIDASSSARRFLDRLGGDGGYMVIFQSDDLAVDRRRIEQLGVRIVWEIAFPDIETIHLHPRDVGGAIVSLDEARPAESWRWAGPSWRERVRTSVVTSLAGVEISAAAPGSLAKRWGCVLDRPVVEADDESYRIEIDRGSIRFLADASAAEPRLTGIDVVTSDAGRFGHAARERGLLDEAGVARIGGVRFRGRS